MFRLGNFDIVGILIRAVAVLLAISVHEMCHGYAAYFLGDKTAKAMGRLSLNPLRHLDPVGALCLMFFGFGWAKPVMVNPRYFKNPKRGMILTSLAGPVSNFILAFLGLVIFKILDMTHVFYMDSYLVVLAVLFLCSVIWLNIGLGVFNLIPIPPLDGSKIFLPLLPPRLFYDIMRYEHLGWIVLLVALGLGVLDPIIGGAGQAVFNVLLFSIGGVSHAGRIILLLGGI